MNTFYQLPEFEKELKKLSRKYPSLISDIEDIKPVILSSSDGAGIGKNFTIISVINDIKIVKVRVQCESLRSRAIRLIYAYHKDKIELVYIEVYFKGDKENEDRERIQRYLENHVAI